MSLASHTLWALLVITLIPFPTSARPAIEVGFSSDPTLQPARCGDPRTQAEAPLPAGGERSSPGPIAPLGAVAGAERGWPVSIDNPIGSPVFYDLDGDGSSEVIAGDQGHVYVFDSAGNLRPGWPRVTGNIDNSPAVGDIDGDGAPEILVGARGAPPKLWAFRADGVVKPGWPVSLPYQNWMNCSNPVIADLNGDGILDVGIADERGVAFYDGHGFPLPGWPYLWTTSQNIQWSGPAVADIDMDGHPEVVVGNNCLFAEGVHVISHDGKLMPGWPQRTAPIFSSPALADLDGDGDLEIVIQDGDWTWMGHSLYAWHHDGTNVSGFPRTISADFESSRSNPAIADIDGDGGLEIISVTGDGNLHILRADGTYLPGYPQTIPQMVISSPQVVDVNGDGIEEIFLTFYQSGSQYVGGWRLDGSMLPGFPKLLLSATQLNAHGSAHIADIDGDARLEIAACGTDFDDGSVCVFEIDGSIYNPASTRMDWPKIRHDVANRGFLPWTDPAAVTDHDLLGGLALTAAPNPAGPDGRIVLRGASRGPGTLSVIDIAGRLLAERKITAPAEAPLRSILGAPLPGGIYWLRWRPEGVGTVRSSRMIVLGAGD